MQVIVKMQSAISEVVRSTVNELKDEVYAKMVQDLEFSESKNDLMTKCQEKSWKHISEGVTSKLLG